MTTPHLIVLSVLPGAKLSCIFQITNSRAEYSNAHSVVLIPLFWYCSHHCGTVLHDHSHIYFFSIFPQSHETKFTKKPEIKTSLLLPAE